MKICQQKDKKDCSRRALQEEIKAIPQRQEEKKGKQSGLAETILKTGLRISSLIW